MTSDERRLFQAVEQRKTNKENPCESCDGTGRLNNGHALACWDCLGQGILLSGEERKAIMSIAGFEPEDLDNDDSILLMDVFD